jgi:hypothetical protein
MVMNPGDDDSCGWWDEEVGDANRTLLNKPSLGLAAPTYLHTRLQLSCFAPDYVSFTVPLHLTEHAGNLTRACFVSRNEHEHPASRIVPQIRLE